MTKIRTATELLEKLNEALEQYEAGEIDDKRVSTLTRITDSMCKIVKTDIDVKRSKKFIGREESQLVDFSTDDPLLN